MIEAAHRHGHEKDQASRMQRVDVAFTDGPGKLCLMPERGYSTEMTSRAGGRARPLVLEPLRPIEERRVGFVWSRPQRDRAGSDKSTEILRPAGLGTRTGQSSAAKWLDANDGTDHVAIHVDVSCLDAMCDARDRFIQTCMQAKREAIARRIDVVHQSVEIFTAISQNVKNWSENFPFQIR